MTKKEAIEWLGDRTKYGKGVHYLSVDTRLTDYFNGKGPVESYSAGIQDANTVVVSGFCETLQEAVNKALKKWMAA